MIGKPANDSWPLEDEDHAQNARDEARHLKIKELSLAYRMRPDLIELGLAMCAEMRGIHEALKAVRGNDKQLMERLEEKSTEFMAIEEAMDDATKDRFWAGLTPKQ